MDNKNMTGLDDNKGPEDFGGLYNADKPPTADFELLEPLLAAYQDALEKGEGQKFRRSLSTEDSDLLSSALKTAEQWIDEALHEFIQAPDGEVGNVIAEMGHLLNILTTEDILERKTAFKVETNKAMTMMLCGKYLDLMRPMSRIVTAMMNGERRFDEILQPLSRDQVERLVDRLRTASPEIREAFGRSYRLWDEEEEGEGDMAVEAASEGPQA
ncbi:hypothetical protein VTJ04DRAFT_10216 [Mycothermus thermophilus]|uniref:uncharacterized protein n=1 Tax=Humicola insolens TaxID=85995 RepID=UPI0037422C22